MATEQKQNIDRNRPQGNRNQAQSATRGKQSGEGANGSHAGQPRRPIASDTTKKDIAKHLNNRRVPLYLPFESRPKSFSEWIYEHRAGILMTIIAYLVFGISFIGAKIVATSKPSEGMTLIDLQHMKLLEQQRELTPEEVKLINEALASLRNTVSDENSAESSSSRAAAQNSEESASLSDLVDNKLISPELAEKYAGLSERISQNRRNFEQGRKAEDNLRNSSTTSTQAEGSDEQTTHAKVGGPVTASFSLEGRSAVHTPKPSYLCEGGGQVVVAISVNRNGDVTSTAIESTTTQQNCIKENALKYAKLWRFNIDSAAGDKQQGTITFLFSPQ